MTFHSSTGATKTLATHAKLTPFPSGAAVKPRSSLAFSETEFQRWFEGEMRPDADTAPELEAEALRVHRFAYLVRRRHEPAYTCVQRYGKTQIESTNLGRILRSASLPSIDFLQRHQLSPELERLSELAASHGLCLFQEGWTQTNPEAINSVIEEWRAWMKTESFSKQHAERRKTQLDLCSGTVRFVRCARDSLRRPAVLRFNLVYGTEYRSELDSCSEGYPPELRHELKKFLDRRSRHSSTKGPYAWKLSFGAVSSYHIQMVLFCEATNLASAMETVKEAWDSATSGRGAVRNTRADSRTLSAGCGEWSGTRGAQKQFDLERSLCYLIQRDGIFRVQGERIRRFQHSESLKCAS